MILRVSETDKDTQVAIVIEPLNLVYFPAPKVANTSIKHALHEALHGTPYVGDFDKKLNRKKHIHDTYKTDLWRNQNIDKHKNRTKFCVVRDPIDRVLSAYRNRVIHHGELGYGKVNLDRLKEHGLPQTPDLATFIENLETYKKLKLSIKMHTRPLTDFLGEDPSYYSYIFDISEIDRLENFISSIAKKKISIPHKQKEGPNVDRESLSKEHIGKLAMIYKSDYEIFGKYFSQ